MERSKKWIRGRNDKFKFSRNRESSYIAANAYFIPRVIVRFYYKETSCVLAERKVESTFYLESVVPRRTMEKKKKKKERKIRFIYTHVYLYKNKTRYSFRVFPCMSWMAIVDQALISIPFAIPQRPVYSMRKTINPRWWFISVIEKVAGEVKGW